MLTFEGLARRAARDAATGCLRWLGAQTPTGYGQIKLAGKVRIVHRVAYEIVHGPIPDGHDIDHVHANGCRHRDCIEPAHLEAVTHAENIRRTARLITACPQGHPYSGDNLIVRSPGQRRACRACKNARHKAYKARRRASVDSQ